jgi:hypothetical protein
MAKEPERRADRSAAEPIRRASQPDLGRPESQAACIQEETTNMAIASNGGKLEYRGLIRNKEIAAP